MIKRLDWLLSASLGLALVLSIGGCNNEPSPPSTKPEGPTTAKPLPDIVKDLKPPVVVKPNLPAATGEQQQQR